MEPITHTLLINGEDYSRATEFVYDGCHKFWLVASTEHRASMTESGWEGDDFHPVSDLPAVWMKSKSQGCFLHFIQWADFTKPDPVTQDESCEEVTIEYTETIEGVEAHYVAKTFYQGEEDEN